MSLKIWASLIIVLILSMSLTYGCSGWKVAPNGSNYYTYMDEQGNLIDVYDNMTIKEGTVIDEQGAGWINKTNNKTTTNQIELNQYITQ